MFTNLHYYRSKFWLIFWLIVFFPIAIVLFANGWKMSSEKDHQPMLYNGHRFWLFFWGLIFVPVAIALLIINGLKPAR